MYVKLVLLPGWVAGLEPAEQNVRCGEEGADEIGDEVQRGIDVVADEV